jgi:hypothetical protein
VRLSSDSHCILLTFFSYQICLYYNFARLPIDPYGEGLQLTGLSNNFSNEKSFSLPSLNEYPGYSIMVHLKIPPENAILLLREKADEIKLIIEQQRGLEYYDYVGLCSNLWSVIDEIYRADERHPEEIRIIGLPTCSCTASTEVQMMLLELYHSRLLDYIGEIREI